MTKPFTAAQKFRILVHHRAVVVEDGTFVPIAKVRFGTISKARRFRLAQQWGCAVLCACGCGVWARLDDVQFDHERQHALGGATVLANGRPLRATPCHRAKTAGEQALISHCDKVARKLRVRSKDEVREARQRAGRHGRRLQSRSSFPSRRIGSSPMRSRFPRHHEATT